MEYEYKGKVTLEDIKKFHEELGRIDDERRKNEKPWWEVMMIQNPVLATEVDKILREQWEQLKQKKGSKG